MKKKEPGPADAVETRTDAGQRPRNGERKRAGANRAVLIERLSILAVSLFLLGYAAVRAARMSFTFDEARTYLEYLNGGRLSFFTFDSANNHFLNSVLAKLSSLAAGNGELALRLPGLLALAIFLWFAYLIADRLFRSKPMAVFGFVLVAANPYVLDFFSLCRGYGLSLAFLLASLHFLFSFIDHVRRGAPGSERRLRFSLAAASLAVLANYTLLDAYLGVVALVFIFFAARNIQASRREPAAPLSEPAGRPAGLLRPAWVAALLAVFNVLVVSHDLNFMRRLFEPVAVDIAGAEGADRGRLEVFALDAEGEAFEVPFREDHWVHPDPAYISAVGFRGPADVVAKIGKVDIHLGNRTVTFERSALRRALRLQRSETSVLFSGALLAPRRSAFPALRSAVNWKGDRDFLRRVLLRLLLMAGVLAAAAALVYGAGWVCDRLRIVRWRQYRPLASSALTLGALIGFPLHGLLKNGALYWGGKSGFFRDTLSSLIQNSFYGRVYFRGQERAVCSLAVAAVTVFLIVLAKSLDRERVWRIVPVIALIGLLVATWVWSAVQHVLFGVPYLFGRTALFLLPIFTLFLLALASTAAEFGPRARMASASILGVLALLLVVHFAVSANVTSTQEWRSDADTKAMLRDLEVVRSRELGPEARLALAVDWRDFATIEFYKQRDALGWLTVLQVPAVAGCSFYYAPDFAIPEAIRSSLTILKRYPVSGTTLARLPGAPNN